jgi:hypothetical protein
MASVIRNYAVFFVIISLFGIHTSLISQNFDRLDVPIYQGTHQLKLPNTGGLRAPQFSNIDLNGDGRKDLFVFDRNGDQVLTFLKSGANGSLDYTFNPEYIPIFPSLRNWALLVDYNKDGITDIYSSSGKYPGSVEVWKGKKDANGRITFKLLTFNYGLAEILQFPISNGYTQIYVSSIDLPAVVDVDSDGDMDMLSFEADGSYSSYYRNVSVEENLGLDSIKYIRQDICWGKFAENAFSCSSGFNEGGNSGVRHSGSSITLFDNDGDGDMDMLLGDIGTSKIVRLFNGGNTTNALVTRIEKNFPADDVPVDLDLFLGTYYVDTDDDGKRDLIVAPNEINSAESQNHIWLYKNVGTDAAPVFKLVKKNFLVDEMAFFNSASHPAFADVNGDGLTDILIGSNGVQTKGNLRKNRLVLLTNNGNEAHPSYVITDEDYLQFSIYGDSTGRFAPAFGDLDADGDLDLLIGDSNGRLYYLTNQSAKGKAMSFGKPVSNYSDIYVGQNAKPQIIDLDNDGLKDLIIGEKNNELNYFKNIGTPSLPNFTSSAEILPNTRQAGKIHSGNNFETQNGAPYFIRSDQKLLMLLGTEDAGFNTYGNVSGNVYGSFSLLMTKTGNIRQGRKVTCSLANIDQDEYYEMVVGNERGGIVFYNTTFKEDTISPNQEVASKPVMLVYPNPANDQFILAVANQHAFGELYTISGTKISDIRVNESFALDQIQSGIYIIKVTSSSHTLTQKLIVQK